MTPKSFANIVIQEFFLCLINSCNKDQSVSKQKNEIVNTILRLRSNQKKIQSLRSVLILTVHLHTLVWAERKYLHFMGTRAEHLIVINIPAVGILLDLAKWEDSKYLVAIALSRLSIAYNTRILSNVKLGILLEPFSYNKIFLVATIEVKSWQ